MVVVSWVGCCCIDGLCGDFLVGLYLLLYGVYCWVGEEVFIGLYLDCMFRDFLGSLMEFWLYLFELCFMEVCGVYGLLVLVVGWGGFFGV